MNLGDQLLAALSLYGIPILAGLLFVGSIGLPLPNTLLLVASGSFVAGGQMNNWVLIIVATAATIAGDVTAYLIGRWAGRAALRRQIPKLQPQMKKAEQVVRKWGAFGIFITRWLITPVGPYVSMFSGASKYPWPHFVFWDVAGNIIWVVGFVSLGRIVASEVQAISAVAADVAWVLFALAIVAVLTWLVFRTRQA
jgi:membrane-associated protein